MVPGTGNAGVGAQNPLMRGAGGAMGGLAQLLFGSSNPSDSAMPFLNQIPDVLKQFLGPYMNAGQGAMSKLQGQYGSLLDILPQLKNEFSSLASGGGNLMNQYNQMLMNPGQEINRIGQNFQESPGFQFQKDQALGAANRAAAASGMAGSPQEQQQIATTVNGLANQDYYNYLGHAQGEQGAGMQGANNLFNTGLNGLQNLFGRGLSGLEGINKMGFDASSMSAEDLISQLLSKANLSYAGQANQNQSQGGGIGAILSGLIPLMGGL